MVHKSLAFLRTTGRVWDNRCELQKQAADTMLGCGGPDNITALIGDDRLGDGVNEQWRGTPPLVTARHEFIVHLGAMVRVTVRFNPG